MYWRGGRVAEGDRLLICYTGLPRIEGSNPSLSASLFQARLSRVFVYLTKYSLRATIILFRSYKIHRLTSGGMMALCYDR